MVETRGHSQGFVVACEGATVISRSDAGGHCLGEKVIFQASIFRGKLAVKLRGCNNAICKIFRKKKEAIQNIQSILYQII